ncbi:MAG: hypothetical protein ACT4QD_10715 [Acidobacteriota bacterium]
MIAVRTQRWTSSLVPVAVLFALGAGVNLYYGRAGFMPLDQGIVFDGAWRLMQGQVPFRDFAAPNAILPSVMQVPFFQLLGVTWFGFVLHAAVVNGLFAVLVYLLLLYVDATRAEATLYAAASAVLFYPPNGTPFMDQHAFFFVTLMLAAVVTGTLAPTPWTGRASWFLVPILFTLAYLSKQIPTAFAALTVAGWVVLNPRRAPQWLPPIAAGTVTVALVAIALQLVTGFSWSQALTYLIVMPLDVGAERTTGRGDLAAVRMVFGTVRQLAPTAQQWTMYVPLVALPVLAVSFRTVPRWRLYGWLLASLFFITGAFLAYTINQVENSFALMMLAAGVSSMILRTTVERWSPRLARARAGVLIAAVIAVVAVVETAAFARHVNATRAVLDTQYNEAIAIRAAPHLPEALSFLRWTEIDEASPEQFEALVRFLREADGNFVLLSDLTPLYALTNRPSVSPALWLHPGLSVPRPGTEAFERLQAELLERLSRYDVRRLVVSPTIRGPSIKEFTEVQKLIASRGCDERRFGLVRVIDLCRP